MRRSQAVPSSASRRRGTVFVEYVLLVTLVGLGVLVGVAALRNSIVSELNQLATAIAALIP